MKSLELLLLECGAVRMNPEHPFTLNNGRISPVYLDGKAPARMPLVLPEVTEAFRMAYYDVAKAYQEKVYEAWKNANEPLYLTIVATSGAACWSSLVASSIVTNFPEMYHGHDKIQGIPFAWVPSVPETHGLHREFKGAYPGPDTPIVVIEDVINTGRMSSAAIRAVKQVGGQPLALIALMDYGFKEAKEALAETKVPVKTLTTIERLIATAEENGYINSAQREMLEAWRKDPDNWKQ